eukprot:3938743-Pleurochrysis_carterae.AAC.3
MLSTAESHEGSPQPDAFKLQKLYFPDGAATGTMLSARRMDGPSSYTVVFEIIVCCMLWTKWSLEQLPFVDIAASQSTAIMLFHLALRFANDAFLCASIVVGYM